MNYLNSFNIKTKLGILFLIFCFSIFVLGYISIQISENSKEKLKMLHDQSQVILLLQDEVISPLYELRETTQSLVMAPNRQIRIDIDKELKVVTEKLDESFLLIKNNHIKIYRLWLEYKVLITTTKQYLEEEFEEGAYVNVTTASKEQFDLLVTNLLNIQSKSLNDAKIAYVNAVDEAKELKIDIFIYLIVILLISIIIGWFVSSNIITSINIVQEGLSDFFDYLNHKRNKANKIVINSNDEFSQMAKIINLNVQTIQNNIEKNEELIRDATQVLESIKSGNLGNRLIKDANSETLNELKFMMNNMLDNLEDKIEDEITQKLEQEQILIQQSKLASMGEMIGNIAHQWRQPLAEISAIHMNMKVRYDFEEFNKEYLNKKIKEANKLTSYMSQTISDFQNFFNPQGRRELFSINKACEDAFFIVESSLKYHNIKTTFEVLKDNEIYGFKNEYSQVILNILSNAKDIFLERKVANPYIKIEIKDGDKFVIVKISDNGGGIEEGILNKIFEPYFTTRHKTQGTGIGLYMSKNIIERNMKGFINVRNEKYGSCFTIKVLKILK
jgi:signal transduction histidine kinase